MGTGMRRHRSGSGPAVPRSPASRGCRGDRRGCSPKAIQARFGHASITTTLNVYGGLLPSLDEELADRLDAARPAVVARMWHAEGADVVPIEH
jgi:integrase